MAYVKEQRYWAHLRNPGIKFTEMNKPENSSWGTINAGISSAATLGSLTELPTRSPMDVLASARVKLTSRKRTKFILNPIIGKAISCDRT